MTWQPGRPRLPESTRRRIFARDGYRCYLCGQVGADQIDHVIPRSSGGLDTDANLAPVHARPCHLRKTQQESAQARWRTTRRRPPEPHPGLR